MSRGRHARDGQRREAAGRWLRDLPGRLELTWRWCHWKLIAHPRYARALRAALHEAVRDIPATPMTPAPESAPAQAPRPVGDPPRTGAARSGPGQPESPAPRGAVRAGQAPDAGAVPSPAADATIPPGGAATLPHPLPVPPSGTGMGQHPFSDRPAWVIFPDDRAALTQAGRTRIRKLEWEGKARETGGLPALVRPAYARHEAWRDTPARWTA